MSTDHSRRVSTLTSAAQGAVIVGLCLCPLAAILAGREQTAPPDDRPATWQRGVRPPPPTDPFRRALRAAHSLRLWAQDAANQERETLDLDDGGTRDTEALRRRLMARQHRILDSAITFTRQATKLARTREELFEARELLAWIDCDTGRHEAEYRVARLLTVLEPRNASSWMALRRAADCTSRPQQVRLAEARLRALERSDEPEVSCGSPPPAAGIVPPAMHSRTNCCLGEPIDSAPSRELLSWKPQQPEVSPGE